MPKDAARPAVSEFRAGDSVFYDSVSRQERRPCLVHQVFDDGALWLVSHGSGEIVRARADPRRVAWAAGGRYRNAWQESGQLSAALFIVPRYP